MMNNQPARQLLEDAGEALRRVVGEAVEFTLDAEAGRLWIKAGEKLVELELEFKARFTPAQLGIAMAEVKARKDRVVIVTRHMTDPMAEAQKEELGIQFIDTAGNAWLNTPPVFVYVRGNKPDKKEAPRRPPARMFGAAGLKVLFALFCDPALVNAPYRRIAACAGVAPAGITNIIRDMEHQGFLLKKGHRHRRLARKKELLRRWVEAFNEKLRPRQIRKRLRTREVTDRDWWKRVDVLAEEACWGGEAAGAKLTHYLVPANLTIYKEGPLGRLQLMYGLEEDPDGNIEIMEPFWGELAAACTDDTVHPVLAYAELLGTHDARAIETAEMIYEQELARLIGED
jgi:hypothetical protein